MAITNKDGFEMNYVYTPYGTDEFKTIFVKLSIENEMMNLHFYSDEEIARIDLENILNAFQDYQFAKMKINIAKECNVVLSVKDEKFQVEIRGNVLGVTDVKPLQVQGAI